MSQFSDKCKKLLEENGSNVYQLSQNASLERTTLQRMVTGKRLPNINFVKNFCRVLRVSQFEEQELLRLYKIETMGETAYHNEEAILQLLLRLKKLEKNNYQENIATVNYEKILFSSNVARQGHNTLLMLHHILAKEFALEKPNVIYTNVPVTCSSLIPTLEMLYQRFQKRLSVMHLISFQMNSSATSENLDALIRVLPCFLSDILDYQVYYHYSRITKNELLHQLFPYYIITTQHVMLISDDLNSAILLTEPDTIEQYRQSFQRITRLSKPLFCRDQTLNYASDFLNSDLLHSTEEFNTLHFQPCFIQLFSKESFISTANASLPPDFSALAETVWQKLSLKSVNSYRIIFSREGLDEFCRTGKYYGQIGTLFPPFSVSQRIRMLKYFLSMNPFRSNIMLKNLPISLPRNLSFELRGTQLLEVIRMENFESIDSMSIEESSICEAFYQFLTALPESDYVYSPEEAENIFLQKISELETIGNVSTPPRKKYRTLCTASIRR